MMKERVVFPKPEKPVLVHPLQAAAVVLKFSEGTHIRLRDGQFVALQDNQSPAEEQLLNRNQLDADTIKKELVGVNHLLQNDSNVQVERMFSRPEEELDKEKLAGEQESDEELADPNLYYYVIVKDQEPNHAATLTEELNKFRIVEVAYPQPFAVPATDISPPTPSFAASQGFLNPAPVGIDARYAWHFTGGKGRGVRIVDVEHAWRKDHEDFPPLFWDGSGINADLFGRAMEHGTAVIGELAARENSYGVTGIVPEAEIGLSTIQRLGFTPVAAAIDEAASHLNRGDILLIEVQTAGPTSDFLEDVVNDRQLGMVPVEHAQAEFDAIQRATSARGVIVVEAAGNGMMALDDPLFGNRFNRATRDSGAIMVGAGTDQLAPQGFTNAGSRVDVQGWGDSVTTMGRGDVTIPGAETDRRQWYTRTFNGTSSASPIVAGAAASIQGIRKAYGLSILNPRQMRDLLRTTGTPQAMDNRQIGPMPNLRAAIATFGILRGHLDLFVTGTDGRVMTTWWDAGSDAWAAWYPVAGGVFRQGTPVAALARRPDHLDVFAVGQDGHVYSTYWPAADRQWAPWFPITNGIFPQGTPIAAVARMPDQLDLFGVGPNGYVYSTYWPAGGNQWAPWFQISDGVFPQRTPVAAVARMPDHLDLFAVGQDGYGYSTYWPAAGGQWSSWSRVSNGIFQQRTPVAAVARMPDHLDLFAVGQDGYVYTTYWPAAGGQWSSWSRVSGGVFQQGTPVAAVARMPDHLDLFAVGQDGRVFSTHWPAAGGQWSAWIPIGNGVFQQGTPVAVVARTPDHLDLFAVGQDGMVWSCAWDGRSGWGPWFPIGNVSAMQRTPVAAVAR